MIQAFGREVLQAGAVLALRCGGKLGARWRCLGRVGFLCGWSHVSHVLFLLQVSPGVVRFCSWCCGGASFGGGVDCGGCDGGGGGGGSS